MENELEFSCEQEQRIEDLYNATYEYIKLIAQKDLEYDVSYIGELVDFACTYVANKLKQNIWFPAIVYDEETDETYMEDYIEPCRR